MDQTASIDTVQMGYEETAYTSQQPLVSHTPEQHEPYNEVQDALALANMLHQLRTQKLHGTTHGEV